MHELINQLRSESAEHQRWKARFLEAIALADPGDLDPVALGRTDRCSLGRWLFSLRAPAWFVGMDDLVEVTKSHEAFHEQAQVIATFVVAGRYQDARGALMPGKSYDLASAALCAALERWATRVPEALAAASKAGGPVG